MLIYRSHAGGDQIKLKLPGAETLVKMVEGEEQPASGLALPDTAGEKPQTAETVAVGVSDEMEVSGRDAVILAKYSGTGVKIEGGNRLIVDIEEIPPWSNLKGQC